MFSLRIFGKDLPVCCQRLKAFMGSTISTVTEVELGRLKKTAFSRIFALLQYQQLLTAIYCQKCKVRKAPYRDGHIAGVSVF